MFAVISPPSGRLEKILEVGRITMAAMWANTRFSLVFSRVQTVWNFQSIAGYAKPVGGNQIQ